MGIRTNQLPKQMSHLCAEAVLHLCFIDSLRSDELLFCHSISEVCVSPSPLESLLLSESISLPAGKTYMLHFNILKWPSDPSMITQFFFLSITDRGLKAYYLTPW